LTGTHAPALRLRRRDDVDLVLTTAPRYEQDHAVLSVATRLFAALMRDAETRWLMLRVLPEVFPWVRFLPADDAQLFVTELVQTLEGANDLENLAPVARLVAAWRHTAEVHADPDLIRALRQDAADHGPVPAPTASA